MDRVRLHARLGKETTVIALCRQAQARILVKEGHAFWEEDRLVLKDAIALPSDVHPTILETRKYLDKDRKRSEGGLANANRLLRLIESVEWPEGVEWEDRWHRSMNRLEFSAGGPEVSGLQINVFDVYLEEDEFQFQVQTIEDGVPWSYRKTCLARYRPSKKHILFMGPSWGIPVKWDVHIPADVPTEPGTFHLPERLMYWKDEEAPLEEVALRHLHQLSEYMLTPHIPHYDLWPEGGHVVVDLKNRARKSDGTGTLRSQLR